MRGNTELLEPRLGKSVQFLRPSLSARVCSPSWLLGVCRHLPHRAAGSSLISSAIAALLLSPSAAPHLHPGEPWAEGTAERFATATSSLTMHVKPAFPCVVKLGAVRDPRHLRSLCTCKSSATVAEMTPRACCQLPRLLPVSFSTALRLFPQLPNQPGSEVAASMLPQGLRKSHPTISALHIEAEGCLHICFYRDTASEVVPGSACLGLFTCCLEKAILSLEYKRDFSNEKPSPFPDRLLEVGTEGMLLERNWQNWHDLEQ